MSTITESVGVVVGSAVLFALLYVLGVLLMSMGGYP